LQPITVTSNFTLISGYHRLTACKELGWDTIPAIILELNGLQAELAEIDENLIRNELTMLERATWQNRRKEIYEILHPEVKHGVNQHTIKESRSGQVGHSSEDKKPENYTENAAKSQGVSERKVRRDTLRGKALQTIAHLIKGTRFENNGKELDELVKLLDPKKGEGIEIVTAVLKIALSEKKLTIKQARLQLKKQMEAQEGKEVEAPAINTEPTRLTFTAQPGQVWKLGRHTLICDNAYEVAKRVKCDALISDPPYGIDYRPDWDKWDGSASDYKRVLGDQEPFDPLPFLIYPTVLLFGANYFSNKLPLGGWLCWDKRTREELDSMAGSSFELAWYCSQHTAKRSIMVRVQHGGVLNADSKIGNNEKRLHPTQKPVELMRQILLSLTRPGEVVLDPFLGSGSTLIACQETGRVCIGAEVEPEYCGVILNRFFNKYNIEPCLE
jgi:DNA modification methylase